MAIKVLIISILALIFTPLAAQNGANVEFSSSQLDSLVACHIQSAKAKKTLSGYRIQIYTGSGSRAMNDAMDAKAKFLNAFPTERIYVEYTAPFWRVRTGDFRFRNEGLAMLHMVRTVFPSCYMVIDDSIRKSTFNTK